MRRGRQQEFLNYVVRIFSEDAYGKRHDLVLTPLCFFWQVAVCNANHLILFEWEAQTVLTDWRKAIDHEIQLSVMCTAQRGRIYYKIEKGIEY
jgi:hypothetical protein